MRSLHSFKFFIKERWFLCVLLRSLWENVAFFAIFYILYKRTQHSFRSFWFHKNNIKEWCILKVVLFAIYIYISIYIYIYIYWKKERGLCMRSHQKNATFCVLLPSFAKEHCILWVLLRSLQKNIALFAFFYLLCKRTLCSLHSFTFLRKECKRTHRSFGLHKSPKTQKRTQNNVACFKRTQKNNAFRT